MRTPPINRHLVPFPSQDPMRTQARKVTEEAAEVQGAADRYDRKRSAKRRKRLLMECADVCQAVTNLLDIAGVTSEEWEQACTDVYSGNVRRGRYGER